MEARLSSSNSGRKARATHFSSARASRITLVESLSRPLSRRSTRAYITPEIRACALSAKILFAPSDAGIRDTRSCVRASALPKVNGLLVLERRRGDLPFTLPDVP